MPTPNLISISPPVTSLRRPEIMPQALEMALSRALAALADREFDASVLANEQRAALERRVQDLARSLAPCGAARTAAILATMGSMASRCEVDPVMASALAGQD